VRNSALEFEPDEVDPGTGVLKNASFLGWAVAAKLEKFSDEGSSQIQ